MQKPVQVAYRELTPSQEITAKVIARVEKLERHFQRMIGCKVTLHGPGRHHSTGRHFRVGIEIGVPGERLVVGRSPSGPTSEDLEAAIDTAFREAKRQLEEHARRLEGRVREGKVVRRAKKAPVAEPPAKVSRRGGRTGGAR